MNWFDLQ